MCVRMNFLSLYFLFSFVKIIKRNVGKSWVVRWCPELGFDVRAQEEKMGIA